MFNINSIYVILRWLYVDIKLFYIQCNKFTCFIDHVFCYVLVEWNWVCECIRKW